MDPELQRVMADLATTNPSDPEPFDVTPDLEDLKGFAGAAGLEGDATAGDDIPDLTPKGE